MINKYDYSNLISLSIAPAIAAVGKQYCDLFGSIELMKDIEHRCIIDGFEFQMLEEWDESTPPMDRQDRRLDVWLNSCKHSVHKIISLIKETSLRILSVHAKRDIGIYLCSNKLSDVEEGKRLINEALRFASEINSPICVFHLWDTWKENFDIDFLNEVFSKISLEYPNVKASIENVPTHLKGYTPYDLAKQFQWITLDLQWAALYNEFEKFIELKDRIVNIHLRGELESSRWVMKDYQFDFYEVLNTIIENWNYRGLLTMEPTKLKEGHLNELITAMTSLGRNG
ncbi:MAG TPA: hypothetical protein PK733_18075 [Clostridiales bacterium]|nr:hypothetical protein [Clostridiales bacterium]